MQCALIDLCFKGESVGALNVLGGGRLLYWVAFSRTSCLIRASQPVGMPTVWKQCKMAAGGEIFPPLVRMVKFQFDGCTGLGWLFSGSLAALGSELTTFWSVTKQFPMDCWII